MRELGIEFEEKLHSFGGEVAFNSFSPTGKVPCLVDEGVAIWDSLAITEYLAEQDARVWPADKAARTWARSVCAEMHSGYQALRTFCSMNCGVRVKLSIAGEMRTEDTMALGRDLTRLQQVWTEGLTRWGGPWLCGSSFCAVDAFFAPVAFRAQTYGLTLEDAPAAYVERLLALPSMQSWYQDALEEPWRDPDHEPSAATIQQDLRAAVQS